MRSPYVVPIADLLAGGEASRRLSVTAPLELRLEQVEVVGDSRLEVQLERLEHHLWVEGRAEVECTFSCVRCLTTWTENVSVPVSGGFSTSPDADYPVTAEGTIDLSYLARDDVAEALPLLPLCVPDCAGLCPTCGTDLNTGRCPGHDTDEVSPFGALRQLIPD